MKKLFRFVSAALCGAFLLTAASCAGEDRDKVYSVYAPDGAPALALARAIAAGDEEFAYHVVASSTIQTFVTGETPQADFCVLPVNLASKLLGDGSVYRMLGTVTHGNMYFLTVNGEALTSENLSSLVGKTVGVVQLANVPGLTLQAVLNDYGIDYAIVGNDGELSETAVNLKATDAAGVTPAGGCDYYLCPEPAASTKTAKTPLVFAGDLQELYGEDGYPQAVIVAKTSLVGTDACEKAVGYLEESAEYLASTAAADIVSLLDGKRTEGLSPSFTAENLTAEVIANCSVSFTASAACKDEVNAFLQKLMSINAGAASAVSDAFYYLG